MADADAPALRDADDVDVYVGVFVMELVAVSDILGVADKEPVGVLDGVAVPVAV